MVTERTLALKKREKKNARSMEEERTGLPGVIGRDNKLRKRE